MRIATIIVVSLFFTAPVLAEDKPAVKEILTKDLKIKFPREGKADKPTEIKTADELAKNEAFKDAADAIKKHINFEKEKLVFFSWGGSGGDRLSGAITTKDKKTVAEFTRTQGLTLDFVMHVHLFVVPKDAEVKVVMGK